MAQQSFNIHSFRVPSAINRELRKQSMNILQLLLLVVICTQVSFAQRSNRRERVPSYFGLQVRPVFPTRFIGEPTLDLVQDNFSTQINQKIGFSFGGTVRAGLTKLLALETGINYTQRQFEVNMSVPDSGVSASNDLTFITYDIPINGLVYIQLSERFYMNASLGILLAFKPSNVGILTTPGGKHTFTHTGKINGRTGFDLNANIGFEYRTEKSGFFYIGGSGRVPFKPLFEMIAQYKYDGITNTQYGEVDGSFLSIDFKYFFPNINNKGPQFQLGPIE